VPIRIHFTDGTAYDVKHPEMAMVTRSTVDIGIEEQNEVIRGPVTRFHRPAFLGGWRRASVAYGEKPVWTFDKTGGKGIGL
jgi:hypothetical protein